MNRQGEIIKKQNFLIQETFFVPSIFNTAYYREKRPLYMKMLKEGEISAVRWTEAAELLKEDMQEVDFIAAFNASFDFKKAIPFTHNYIWQLYSDDYNEWERLQYNQCHNIIMGLDSSENPEFLNPSFEFMGITVPIVDLWSLACDLLVNNSRYKDYCLKTKQLTSSAQYFKTSAETVFQYLMKDYDFIEDHTALSDAIIEAGIFAKALRKKAAKPRMDAFPFRNLGTTIEYVEQKKREYIPTVVEKLNEYLEIFSGDSAYRTRVENLLAKLEAVLEEGY